MELEYTYFETEDGFFVGWFDRFPEDVTQGKSLEELEEMLTDMYECLNLAKYHNGHAEVHACDDGHHFIPAYRCV